MPIVKRVVEPVLVCREKIPQECPDDLEAVSVNALSGILQQLSCLAKHADAIFGELTQEATICLTRTSNMFVRVQNIKQTLEAMDYNKAGKSARQG